jgi:hypothetical protein
MELVAGRIFPARYARKEFFVFASQFDETLEFLLKIGVKITQLRTETLHLI